MRRISLVALLVACAWTFASCSAYLGVESQGSLEKASADGAYAHGLVAEGRIAASADPGSSLRADRDEATDSSVSLGTAPAKERKVVYTAEYALRTSNLEVALARAKALAESMGGWVQEEGSAGFVFRVPADKFWETTHKIQEIGRVLDHAIKSKDVTEQYTDLGIRLSVRKKFLTELQALYAKGGSLQDLLAVKKEIDRVTEEIERLEGKIRYLEEQIAWSTIRLRFQVQSEFVTRDFNLPFRWLQSLGIQTLLNAR